MEHPDWLDEMFGYLGVGMILYSLFHYIQIKQGERK